MEILQRNISKERAGMRGEEQEQRSKQQVLEDRWEGRERRTYIVTDIRKKSLKIVQETERGKHT